MKGINLEDLTNLIDIGYVWASKWSLVAMTAIFWPSGHFTGHKYKNQYKFAMWGINLEDLTPLIDIGYV
jgi:hypothetical protein